MSDKILDDRIKATRFKKPVTLKVDKVLWESRCDELQKKSVIGIFIFLAISMVVAIFTYGLLIFMVAVGVAVFLNLGVRRRFEHLRSLHDRSWIASSDQISQVNKGKKEIIHYKQINSAIAHSWGVTIDTRKKRKSSDKSEAGKFTIPNAVNDYPRLLVTLEPYLEK